MHSTAYHTSTDKIHCKTWLDINTYSAQFTFIMCIILTVKQNLVHFFKYYVQKEHNTSILKNRNALECVFLYAWLVTIH